MSHRAKKQIATYTTNSPEQTIALGRELAALLPPKIILLRGDLGAGKTTLVKGIAVALNAASPDEVTSPTFTLIHHYTGGKIPLYHLDLYRLTHERELIPLGLEEMEDGETGTGALLLIEWGEKFPSLTARAWGEIQIQPGEQTEALGEQTSSENSRKISLSRFIQPGDF